jgi:hypothetical protein
MRTAAAFIALLVMPGLAWAQYGGQYPGQGGIGIPGIPGVHMPKKKQKPADDAPKVTYGTVDGTLRKLSDKELLLQGPSHKIMQFRLDEATEFRKVTRDSLQPGDHLTVEVNLDEVELALHVILDKRGSDKDREAASEPFLLSRIMTPDKEDFPKKHVVKDASTTAKSDSPKDSAPPSDGSFDPDRPSLRRTPDTKADAPAADAPPESGAPPSKSGDSTDDVISDAREATATFSADLPNFAVQQVTTRFSGSRSIENWKLRDTVTADVASVNGKEEYRNIRVNGSPTDRPEDSGTWSTGEFQVTLTDLLSSRTAAEFTARGADRIAGRDALVFDFSVDQPHSHWTLVDESGKRVKPAYRGKMWVDKETRRVLRLEKTAIDVPREFGFDKEEASLEYGFVSIDGRRYLLPVESIDVACGRGSSNCSRNRIQFRNYHKFSSDSTISFGN